MWFLRCCSVYPHHTHSHENHPYWPDSRFKCQLNPQEMVWSGVCGSHEGNAGHKIQHATVFYTFAVVSSSFGLIISPRNDYSEIRLSSVFRLPRISCATRRRSHGGDGDALETLRDTALDDGKSVALSCDDCRHRL